MTNIYMNNKTNEPKHTFYFEGKNYDQLLVDTSIFLNPHFEDVMRRVLPALQMGMVKISVLWSVKNELTRFAQSNGNDDRRTKAERALQNISALYHSGLVRFCGNPSATVGDNQILEHVLRMRHENKKVLVFTNDHALSEDLLSLNRMGSSFAPACNTRRISKNGALEKFDFAASKSQQAPAKKESDPQLKAVLARFGL